MCASILSFLRAGPPPPKVALLPDAMFFTRAIPITAGATPAEATAQIELALEAVSPFPLAQLYYGWFWVPGADSALVFAAYRRRFTTDQVAAWDGAEVVLPSFGAVLGAEVQPATTVLLSQPEGLTAVYWEKPPIPAKVLFAPLTAEATDEDRARARDELLRSLGGSQHVVELAAPPVADPGLTDREVVFHAPEFEARLATQTAAALDVRDKAELAALRSARKRDVMLWRVTVGAVAALVLLGVGELALVAGQQWQNVRLREITAQKPVVDKIVALHTLANRIDEIATKRLLPIEMVEASAAAKPAEVVFTQAVAERARGLHTLVVRGYTGDPAQINAYESALRAQPTVQSATATLEQMRNDRSSFVLTVVFKPDALHPQQATPATKTAAR